jgi:hypothetical protein
LQIEPTAFEDTGDSNINLILKLVYEIHSLKESLRNLNGLSDIEV